MSESHPLHSAEFKRRLVESLVRGARGESCKFRPKTALHLNQAT
jgi:hypothetical protein